ncbi:MAG: hypothetical protein ACOYI6_04450 [Christensenellales bacterium]
MCGYRSLYAFSNAFKQAYQQAPQYYRQAVQAGFKL